MNSRMTRQSANVLLFAVCAIGANGQDTPPTIAPPNALEVNECCANGLCEFNENVRVSSRARTRTRFRGAQSNEQLECAPSDSRTAAAYYAPRNAPIHRARERARARAANRGAILQNATARRSDRRDRIRAATATLRGARRRSVSITRNVEIGR